MDTNHHQDLPPLHEIRSTSYGGRGAFAIADIPKETLVFSCLAPYASVIMRKFRKEVCSWCYAYAFESGRNKWDVKAGAGKVFPFYFCSQECMDTWTKDYQGSEIAGVWTQLSASLERLYVQETTLLSNTKQLPKITSQASNLTTLLSDLSASGTSAAVVTSLWAMGDEVFSVQKAILPTLRNWGKQLDTFLTEFELDAARFLLDGLFRRSMEEVAPDAAREDLLNQRITSLGSWQDMMKLQDMETNTIRTHPEMLASFIRVYGLLKHLISSVKVTGKPPILDILRTLLSTPNDLRALIARDHSNVFGIWEQANEGENEMLGWDCSPNLKKRASGRVMNFHTIRDVKQGEELCTNYIDIAENIPVAERTKQLERGWFFTCLCKRCQRERDEAGAVPSTSPGEEHGQ